MMTGTEISNLLASRRELEDLIDWAYEAGSTAARLGFECRSAERTGTSSSILSGRTAEEWFTESERLRDEGSAVTERLFEVNARLRRVDPDYDRI